MICPHDLPISAKCRKCYEEAMAKEAELVTKGHKPKSLKQKRCKQCKENFTPRNTLHHVCSPQCGELFAKASRLKKERKETRARLKDMETLPVLKKRAQLAFNGYIRQRDQSKTCICCGSALTSNHGPLGGSFDCGHYRSVGSAPHLRFNEDNAHGQKKYCNQYGAGRAVDYRIGLIARIGLERVEALESDNAPRNYTRQELIDLAAHYRAKTRDLMR